MNKLFTKIVGAALGLTMAVGVGVAVSSNREAVPVHAAETPGSTQTLTITRNGFSSTTASYAWYDWSVATSGGTSIGGKAEIYASTTASMQFNKGKGNKQGAIFNTTALPGSITKIEATTASGTNRTWNAYTTSTACSLNGTSLSFGSNKTTVGTGVSITTSSTTIGTSTAGHSYFCIQENVSSASYIAQFKITYTVPGTKYKVTFNANNTDYTGSTPSPITQSTVGGSITLPAALSCTGYDWLGWNTSSSGGQSTRKTAGSSYTPEDNITLFGEWQKKNYTVDGSEITGGYLSSTASISHGDPLDIYLVASSNYALPNSITVKMGGSTLEEDTDYTYDDPTESNPGEITILEVTGNIEISAACVPQGTAYTVTYNANSGTVSPASEEVIENGHPSFPTPTRSGYNFKGWQVNGSGTAYTDPEDYTVTGDVTFVASWVAVYTVTFNANGGSSTPASQSVESGSTFTFPSAGTKTHYSFDGWTSTGDEPYYAVGATSPAVTGNITYTAHWTEDAKYTVTYSAASPASGSYAHNNNYGGTYTLLPFASLSGITYDSDVYQFKNYTVGGVNKNPGDTFTLSASTTVTVNFEEKPLEYQITFGTAEGTSGITSFSNTAYVIPSGVTLNNIQGNIYSNTSNQAASLRFGKSGTTGSFDATITGNYYIVSVKCNLKYYGSDSTATFAVTPNGGSAISKSLTSSWADYTYDVSSAKATKVTLGTDVNGKRAYLSGFTITYAALPELDSVTTSGQKATFKAGEKFSYGGTLTAHYTKGKADATVTPASYKVGASGIDPTSAGTAITAATTMTIDAHNGKYIYVVYTEDNITKWASYQITVGPADPTGIVLSPSSATIGIDETFSFTDVEVTINPSEYATQNAYEWVMVDDLGLDVEFDYPDIVVHEDSNGEPLIIRCRSTVDNSVYADFELTVSGNPIAVLYDANDDDVTSGSASYYADYGNDIYYHVSATNFGTGVSYTWSSSNTSILSVDDNDGASCGYYIEDGASGTARLSCVVSGSKGSATVYVDVTITAVSVSAVTWSAPTIDVFSGATLSASDTSSWNVKYSTNSGKTNLTPDSFNVKLGGSTISLPHTWVAADHNKTLCVEVGGVSSSTTTVAVTQSINNVYAETFSSNTSDLTFTAACGGSGTADDSKAWTVTSDGTESSFDSQNGKGIHYGTGSAAVQYIKLTSTAFTSGKITKVEVNASTASGVSATVSVTVGGEAFGGDPQDLTSSAVPDNPYTFTGNVDADTIEVLITKPESATKALYCKSVVVTYETSSGQQQIANNASHKAAQRVAVKFANTFNAAMDETENCTTGLDDAWSTCSAAYTTFLNEAKALGSTEEEWALNLVKYATVQYSDDSAEACIERMMKTYEICVQRHGKNAFMNDLKPLDAQRVVNPIALVNKNTNTVLIIAIVSVITTAAIGGYFFLRKRKED